MLWEQINMLLVPLCHAELICRSKTKKKIRELFVSCVFVYICDHSIGRDILEQVDNFINTLF